MPMTADWIRHLEGKKSHTTGDPPQQLGRGEEGLRHRFWGKRGLASALTLGSLPVACGTLTCCYFSPSLCGTSLGMSNPPAAPQNLPACSLLSASILNRAQRHVSLKDQRPDNRLFIEYIFGKCRACADSCRGHREPLTQLTSHGGGGVEDKHDDLHA